MGNGASSQDVEQHLRRWELAVNDINSLCNNHRRQLGMDGNTSGAGGDNHFGASGGGIDTNKTSRLGVDDEDADRSMRGRRASSISFNKPRDGATDCGAPSGGGGGAGHGAQIISLGLDNIAAERGGESRTPGKLDFFPHSNEGTKGCKVGGAVGGLCAVDGEGKGGVEKAAAGGITSRHNRQQLIEARKARTNLFKSYVDVPIDSVVNKLACDHFATVAIALSTALGGSNGCTDRKLRVTVEDIFFAAHVPLHLVHKEGLCLTELYDIVREFVDVDNRFKQYQVEVLYLDIAPTIGQVEIGANDVGDRQSKLQLPQFIRTVQHELDETTNSVMILNYDPFVLEQETMMDDDDDDDGEGGGAGDIVSARGVAGLLSAGTNDVLMGSTMLERNKKARFAQNNKGAYAAAVEYRQSVSTMITLCHGVTDERLHGELEEVPINSLYKAMTVHAAGERARGYLRVSKVQGGDEAAAAQQEGGVPNEDMELFYTPELASGKVIGSLEFGTHAHTISTNFSPHLVAFAWSLHLINGASAATQNYGRGLPVGDIIRTMSLPSDVYLGCDLGLEQVFLYGEAYLHKKGFDKQFTLSYHPVLTPIARENAAPTISVFDLESILIDIKGLNDNKDAPSSIMILQYNAEVAHNVLGITQFSQWCVLAGYDSATQMATLIDANMQTFSGKWMCPLDRLHKAITGYGYLQLTRAEVAARIGKSLESSRSSTPSAARTDGTSNRPTHAAVQSRVEMVKAAVLMDTSKETVHTFPFPQKPFAITAIALTLNQLGLTDTTFDTVISKLPFHPSAAIDGHFGLAAMLICFRKYLTALGQLTWFDFEATFFDPERRPSEKEFTAMLKRCEEEDAKKEGGNKSLLVLHYDHKKIKILGSREPFGDYGIFSGLSGDNVIVTDANPNRFYRTWQIPIASMYAAICHRSHVSRRSRGVILATRLATQRVVEEPTCSRSLTLITAPLQNLFLVSPSPQIQAISIAFAQLGHFHSPEEVFYEAYLKTMEDQRRRGSQAFAWRDVDVSLAILNRKIDKKVMASVARKFIESRKVQSLTAEHLNDVEEDKLPDMLFDACSNTSDHVLLLNYDTATVHKLNNMGSSVAIVKSFNANTLEVTLMDCEYCLFGMEWRCTLAELAQAADIDNAGASRFGFVRIKAESQQKRAGIGLATAGTGAGGNHHREKVAMFVE